MDYFNKCVLKYNSDLYVELRQHTASTIALHSANSDATADFVDHSADLVDHSADLVDHLSSRLAAVSATRTRALTKKNKKQEMSAMKEMKRCGKVAKDLGAAVGAIVTLKVDFRTHSHAEGLIAIVYNINMDTGSILVCCDRGVITHSGNSDQYWVLLTGTKFVQNKMSTVLLTTTWWDFAGWCAAVFMIRLINPGFRTASCMKHPLMQPAHHVGTRDAIVRMVSVPRLVDARKRDTAATVGVVAMEIAPCNKTGFSWQSGCCQVNCTD
jgi:uncharacterized protein YbjQ (UPF0145 family)